MESTASINLIKRNEDTLDQVLRWSLSIGRLLVIVTEIVAFSTFIYRFSLDRTIIDLHSEIKKKQAVVDSFKNKEDIYRNLQERILITKDVNTNGSKNLQILNDIVGLTPGGITFNSFNIDNSQINISSNVISTSSLSTFIKGLRSYEEISSVTITSINNLPGSSGINVTIVARLKTALQE